MIISTGPKIVGTEVEKLKYWILFSFNSIDVNKRLKK